MNKNHPNTIDSSFGFEKEEITEASVLIRLLVLACTEVWPDWILMLEMNWHGELLWLGKGATRKWNYKN